MLPCDTLSRDGCLGFLTHRVAGFHIGGKTALDWRGIRQNVSFREVLMLWGEEPERLPAWFTQRFSSRYQATHLFDDQMPKTLGLQPLPAGRPDVLVSVPERALLELLSDVGKTQPLEEARQLVELLHTLREKVLDQLLMLAGTHRVRNCACDRQAADGNVPLGLRHSKVFCSTRRAGIMFSNLSQPIWSVP